MSEHAASSAGAHGSCPMSGLGSQYRPFEHRQAYQFFAKARTEEPIFWNEEIGYWVVTRREDVLSILRDPDRFSATIVLEPVCPYPQSLVELLQTDGFTAEPTLASVDRPRHTRIRMAAAHFLNAKQFQSYESSIRDLTRDYIAAMKGKAKVDLVAELTYELPARVAMLLLGVTDIDPRKLKQWGDLRLLMTFGKLTEAQLLESGKAHLDSWFFCRDIVQQRIKEPGNDYPSRMLALRNGDDSILTVNEITSLAFGLTVAAHETTTNATSNLILSLMQNPDQWQSLRSEPALVPKAVEEGLRFQTSVVNWRRRALEDVEIGGIKIKKGSNVLISLGSANHDEAKFENGEAFDITRTNSREHLTFGFGTHFCIGAPLARLEMKIILEELLAAFPNMRLSRDREIEWLPTIAFRGPKALFVELGS